MIKAKYFFSQDTTCSSNIYVFLWILKFLDVCYKTLVFYVWCQIFEDLFSLWYHIVSWTFLDISHHESVCVFDFHHWSSLPVVLKALLNGSTSPLVMLCRGVTWWSVKFTSLRNEFPNFVYFLTQLFADFTFN